MTITTSILIAILKFALLIGKILLTTVAYTIGTLIGMALVGFGHTKLREWIEARKAKNSTETN